MKISSISAWTIFLLIVAPEVAWSELKRSQDQAPQFLFVLHSDQGSYVTEGGGMEILQFPRIVFKLSRYSSTDLKMSDLNFVSPESEAFGNYAI